jgi:hypothetical protein
LPSDPTTLLFETGCSVPKIGIRNTNSSTGRWSKSCRHSSNRLASARFAILLGIHLLKHPIAHITDAQGGYDIDDDNNYSPDVGIILKSRLPELPVDSLRERYLKAGVKLLWYAYPQRKEVEVHRPDQPVEVIDINGVLDASPVLPNCLINVADVFA